MLRSGRGVSGPELDLKRVIFGSIEYIIVSLLCLSVCQCVYLLVSLSAFMSVCLCVLSFCQRVRLSACVYVYISVCLIVLVYLHVSVCLSLWLHVSLYIYLCLSVIAHQCISYEESVVVRFKSNLLLMSFCLHIINYNS